MMRKQAFILRLALAAFFLAFLEVSWLSAARAAEEPPEEAYIDGVHGHAQKYSLSCESRSAVDWAAYFGVEIGEKSFLKNLPKSDNPNRGFVGKPDDPLGKIPPASYGVHATPVADLLREYGAPAQAAFGLDWEVVKAEIAAGRPVIVWVIGQMWDGQPVEYNAEDGEPAVVAAYEHTMILVGYSPKRVIAIDASDGQERSYSLRSFLTSWKVLGRMAIVYTPPVIVPVEAAVTSTPIPAESSVPVITEESQQDSPEFYRVKRGEYLTKIAKRFGINWKTLADLNNLTPPYTLYVGQKLRLP